MGIICNDKITHNMHIHHAVDIFIIYFQSSKSNEFQLKFPKKLSIFVRTFLGCCNFRWQQTRPEKSEFRKLAWLASIEFYSSSQRNMTRLDVSLNFQLNVRRLVVARSVRKSHATDLQAVIAKQLAKYLQICKLVPVRS